MRPPSWHDPTSEMEIFACCPEKYLYRRSPAKLEYACAVWSRGSTQKLQKLCTRFSRRNGTALQPLQKRFAYHTLVMFYEINSRNAPPYLTSLLPPLSLSSGYTFRKLSYRFQAVKRTSTMNSFLPRAVDLWNELPMDIQQSSSTFNGTYAKVRASLATALMRGKSIRRLYESLWFVPCLLAVCLLLKRFFSSLARFAGSSATHTLRKNICSFFSWPGIREGPELLDAEGRSSIAPLRRGTCRRSKSLSL